MAELFGWDDSFGVGLQEIDEQHKVLVGLLNELHESIVAHHGSAVCREILGRLADYTRTHFVVEESLMRLLNYPDFGAHKQQHDDLIKEIHELQSKLDSGHAKITFELLHFLKVWLSEHIKRSDKKFGTFALGRGLAAKWEDHVEKPMKTRGWSWKFW